MVVPLKSSPLADAEGSPQPTGDPEGIGCSRDGTKINWKFDRRTARRKFGYKRKSFMRSKT